MYRFWSNNGSSVTTLMVMLGIVVIAAPALLSALNDKGGVAVRGDSAGTFVVIWSDSAGDVEAVTIPPG